MAITNIELNNLAINEIENGFLLNNVLDGNIATEQDIKNSNNVFFYRTFCNSEAGKAKTIYITYDTVNNTIVGRADNKTRDREIFVRLDIFSRKSFSSSDLITLQNALENHFQNNMNWEINLENQEYNDDTKIYQLNYNLFKTFN